MNIMKDMNEKSNEGMNSKTKTLFESAQIQIKNSLFSLLYILLKHQDTSIFIEIIYVIIQTLQLLSFSFHPIFRLAWKQEKFFTRLSNIFQYFNIVHFFEAKREMYLVLFYATIIIVILVIFMISYVSFSFSKNRNSGMWTLPLLRVILPLITSAFFTPILFTLFSVLTCVDNKNIYVPSLHCWSVIYYVHCVFSIIIGASFILLCAVIQITYFENKFNIFNPKAKSTSKADLIFLIVKAVYVILFCFVCPSDKKNYFFLIILLFLAGFMTYSYYEIHPYYNVIAMKAYKGLCLIFFWSTVALTLSLVCEISFFNGGLSMFFIGIPIIVCIIFTEHEDIMGILLTHMIKFKRGQIALMQIRYVMDLIDKKENDRNAQILLKGYIFQYETNCIIKDCPLKKYIASINNDNNTDTLVFLLHHVEIMYQIAITKFPLFTKLRLSFASFLFERMNKRLQATLELKNTEKNCVNFEEQFIIYRYNRILEEQTTDLGDIDDNLDTVSNIEYKNHLTLFKNAISKASFLYIDFWSLLLTPNQDNQEDLTKLNDYGSKINVLVEEINNHFDKMQKLKHNDPEAISYYSDFLNDILNDKEKASHYKNRLSQIEEPKKIIDDINLLFNIESSVLNSNEEYQYLIVSALPDKFGIITNISLGVCNIFGYTKNELIGKMIEVIMPEIYHKGHREILVNKINDFKKLLIDIVDLKMYQPEYKTISTFGKNKSRYLVPFNIKTALIPNEENEISFVCKIFQNPINVNTTYQTCYIITNSYLTIQNFTANSVNLLGMTSNAINSTVDITEFIKQFNEEFLRYAIDNEEKTFEQKMQLKRTILSKKYKNPAIINWKRSEDMFDTKPRSKIEMNTSNVSVSNDDTSYNFYHSQNDFNILKHKSKSTKIINEELFVLSIQDVILRNVHEGYIFKFETQFLKKKELSSSSILRPLYKIGQNERISSSQTLKREVKLEDSINKHKTTVIKQIPIDQSEDLLNSNYMVDKTFIPNNNLNFQLDPSSLTYKQYEKNPIDCRVYLKNEAIKRIKDEERKKTIDESSETFTSNYSSSEQDQSETITSNHNDERDLDGTIINPKKEQAIATKSKEEYYKVDVSMIKYSIYDFARGTVIEIKDYDKTDQVKFKLSDDAKSKEAILTAPTESKEKIERNSLHDTSEIIETQEKGHLLIKQIEYVLEKEETQPTIQKMKWICFIVLLLLLGCGGALMGFIVESFTLVKENVHLIEKAYDLIVLNNYGIYYIRELTLLNNENYTLVPNHKKVEYSKSIYNNTLKMFIQAHTYLGDIITSYLPLSANHSFLLTNTSVPLTIIEEDYSITQFNFSLISSFIETNIGLFHIGNGDFTLALPTNKDIFFFLYNSLNQMVQGYTLQAKIFILQYDLHFNKIMIYLICIFIAILIVLIGIFFLMANGYNGVVRRKESYLEVFFEISSSIIKLSLEKCENFNKKIHADLINDMMSTSFDKEIDDNIVIGTEVKKESHHRKNDKTSKETKCFNIKTLILLCLVGGFSFAINFKFLLYLEKIRTNMMYYKNKIELEAHYMFLFNSLREYMFDPSAKIMNTVSEEYIVVFLEEFYNTIQIHQDVMNDIMTKMPETYYTIHTDIVLNSACDNIKNNFPFNDKCYIFLANLTGFGLEVVLAYFVEEIRFMRGYAKDHIDQQRKTNLIFNLTLENTELGKSYWPSIDSEDYQTYKKLDQINLFNDNYHHFNLNILFARIILPNFHILSMKFKDLVESSLDITLLIFIIFIVVYLAIVLIGYLFFWVPFAQKLNRTIYKTKNMLSIIPKEVLASLTNINKLLDIGQNLVNNNNNRFNH